MNSGAVQLLTRRRTPATAAAFGASFFSAVAIRARSLCERGGGNNLTTARINLASEYSGDAFVHPER